MENLVARGAVTMRLLFAFVAGLLLTLGLVVSVGAQGPTLTVTTPADGGIVQGSTVTVTFQASGITIVPSTVPLSEAGKHPEANRPGEGHVHLMLDLQPLVVWYRTDPYSFTNVPAGEHQLMVELVNNDHSSLKPPVVQQIRFTTGEPPGMLPVTGQPLSPRLDWGIASVVLGIILLAAGRLLLERKSG